MCASSCCRRLWLPWSPRCRCNRSSDRSARFGSAWEPSSPDSPSCARAILLPLRMTALASCAPHAELPAA
eukprot:1708833-Prymnesium_polylepis.1